MRAYHETGVSDRVQVKTWRCGTPPTLMFTGDRQYFRDVTLTPSELLELAHQIGREQAFKYLFSLQAAMDRTNGNTSAYGR